MGLLVLPERPVDELVATARLAEEAGYSHLWVADEKFYRDPLVVLTAAGQATRRIVLGTGVTEPYARHPALIAMALATLEEAFPDRVVVGLGAGGPGFPPMGVERRRPARALREATEIIRALLRGERVDYEGEVLSFRGGSLNFTPRRELPVYIAARGERVLAAAGACADGVIMAPFASRAAVEHASGLVRRGAERAGRPVPKLAARVDVCIADTRAAARDAVRYFVALPLWVSYPSFAYTEALGIEQPPGMRELLARRDYRDIRAAGDLLPDAMIDHFAIAGTLDDVVAQLTELAPLVDQLIVHPVVAAEWPYERIVTETARAWAAIQRSPQ